MEDCKLRRSCPLAQNYFPAGLWDRIYVEAVRYVEIVPLAQNSPAGTSFRWDLEGWSNQRVDLNQAIDSTNLQDPIETKCRPENFAPAVQCLRSVQLLRRSDPTTQRGNNFAPEVKIYVAYDLPRRSELTRQRRNFYVV